MKVGDLEHFKNMSFLAHSARGALRILMIKLKREANEIRTEVCVVNFTELQITSKIVSAAGHVTLVCCAAANAELLFCN